MFSLQASALEVSTTTRPLEHPANNDLVFGRYFTDHMLQVRVTRRFGEYSRRAGRERDGIHEERICAVTESAKVRARETDKRQRKRKIEQEKDTGKDKGRERDKGKDMERERERESTRA